MAISPLTLPKTKSKTQPTITDESHQREEHQDEFEQYGVNSEDGLWVSEEIYWRDYYEHPDFNYEWNNGILEEKPMADFGNASIYLWFLELLRRYLWGHPIAKITVLEIGFRLELPDGKVSIRKPDLGIILNDNQVDIGCRERTYQGVFDICVESLSDSHPKEKERDTKQKRKEYEAIGVREYYILDDKAEETVFYRRNEAGGYEDMVGNDKELFQSEVLPGFQFRISDLHKQPSPLEMVEDEIYRDFISVEYQVAREQTEQEKARAERVTSELKQEQQRADQEKARAERVTSELKQEQQRAEQEKARAEQEKARADQEKARADQMTAKLKALGISPD